LHELRLSLLPATLAEALAAALAAALVAALAGADSASPLQVNTLLLSTHAT